MAVASASNTHLMNFLSNDVAHTTLLTLSRLENTEGESPVELEDEGTTTTKSWSHPEDSKESTTT